MGIKLLKKNVVRHLFDLFGYSFKTRFPTHVSIIHVIYTPCIDLRPEYGGQDYCRKTVERWSDRIKSLIFYVQEQGRTKRTYYDL